MIEYLIDHKYAIDDRYGRTDLTAGKMEECKRAELSNLANRDNLSYEASMIIAWSFNIEYTYKHFLFNSSISSHNLPSTLK